MGKKLLLVLGTLSVLFSTSCVSEYEKLRKDGSAEDRLAKARVYLEKEDCFKAQILFESVVGAFRGRKEQEEIYFDYAKSHYYQGSYLTAANYFNNFASTYTNSEKREEADYMVAYSYYMLSPSYKLDQTHTSKAINQFQLFSNIHPNSERIPEVNRLIDELRAKQERRAFYEGELYYNLKQYEAATVAFKNLLKDFPESPNAEKVRYLIAKGSYKWAENSILTKQEERYTLTSNSAEAFLSKHTSSGYIKEVKSILADSNNKLKEIRNE